MKLVPHATAILLSAGLGFAVGRSLRINSAGQARTSGVVVSNVIGSSQSPANRHKALRFDDSPLATQLAHDLSMSPPVTKWLCWMTALEKAQPADFPRLARMARGNPAVWRCVVARWVETAPRELFDTLVALSKSGGGDLPINELGRELFEKWAKTDAEAAIAALNEGTDLGPRGAWRMQVASTIINSQPERGLELMSQWSIENYGPRMDAVNKWAEADPRHAVEFIMAHPAGYASQLAMDAAGRAWARSDPTAALDFAAAQASELGSHLATTVLQAWAAQNLTEAADWLAGTDAKTLNRLSPAFVEIWAKQDASAALSWCEESLSGTQLAQAVSGVMKGAAEKDIAGAAAMVSAMEPGVARSAAAAVVAQKWFPQLFSNDPLKPETLTWLYGLDHDSVRQVLSQISWDWAGTDPKGMATFLAKASNDEVPPYVDSVLARQMARSTPVQALDWAASLPGNRAMAAGSDAFSDWQQAQPEAALAWVEGLTANDPRRQPFLETLIKTLAVQPQAPQEFSAFSPGDQTIAQNVIAKMSLPDNQRAKLMDSLRAH